MHEFINAMLHKKDFSVSEVIELVKYLRTKMNPAPLLAGAIDTCGTGGDYANTLNVSTISAFVCAAAGVRGAKHGNRASTSKCGSFDLLEALGININLTHQQISECFQKTGLTFLFAPAFHPAFKEFAPIRKALGIKTIFNYIGPLLNPALVRIQLIGVSEPHLIPILGEALMELGSERVVFINGLDGIDEVSISAPTAVHVFEKNKQVKKFQIEPPKKFSITEIQGAGPAENAHRTRQILLGKGTPAETMFVTLNSALALYAGGKSPTVNAGIVLAQEILKNGDAHRKLEDIIAVTNKKI